LNSYFLEIDKNGKLDDLKNYINRALNAGFEEYQICVWQVNYSIVKIELSVEFKESED